MHIYIYIHICILCLNRHGNMCVYIYIYRVSGLGFKVLLGICKEHGNLIIIPTYTLNNTFPSSLVSG